MYVWIQEVSWVALRPAHLRKPLVAEWARDRLSHVMRDIRLLQTYKLESRRFSALSGVDVCLQVDHITLHGSTCSVGVSTIDDQRQFKFRACKAAWLRRVIVYYSVCLQTLIHSIQFSSYPSLILNQISLLPFQSLSFRLPQLSTSIILWCRLLIFWAASLARFKFRALPIASLPWATTR